MKSKIVGCLVTAKNILNGYVKKGPPGGLPSFSVGGKVLHAPEVVQTLQAMVGRQDAVEAALGALITARETRDATGAQDAQFVRNLEKALAQVIGPDTTALAGYGVAAKQQGKRPSAETIAVANAKRAASRSRKAKILAQLDPLEPQVVVLGPDGKPIGPEASSANEAPAPVAATGSATH
jgi:hypothetical protein